MANLDLDLSEGDLEEYEDKCRAILDFADEAGSHFDSYFVEDVLRQMKQRKFITGRQKASIDKIIQSFEIDF